MRTKILRRSLKQRYFLETINFDANLFYEMINAISVLQVVIFFFQFLFRNFKFNNFSKISMTIYQDLHE